MGSLEKKGIVVASTFAPGFTSPFALLLLFAVGGRNSQYTALKFSLPVSRNKEEKEQKDHHEEKMQTAVKKSSHANYMIYRKKGK